MYKRQKIYITNNAIQNCGRQAVIFAINVTMVSAGFPLYTALITPNKMPKGILITKALREKNIVIGTLSANTSTVSYTHLDVYKRQVCSLTLKAVVST